MTLASAVALFAAMAVLAAVPSVSVLVVSSRAAAAGFAHGALAAAGVVAGDVVFILLALFGLVLVAEALGELFVLVKYLGAAYLVWLGIRLWRGRTAERPGHAGGGTSPWSSFTAGLLITLGDQKAILFYLGFLPAFMDMGAVTVLDALRVIAIAVVAVGGTKLAYAYAAGRLGARAGGSAALALRRAAAGVLVAAGLLLAARA